MYTCIKSRQIIKLSSAQMYRRSRDLLRHAYVPFSSLRLPDSIGGSGARLRVSDIGNHTRHCPAAPYDPTVDPVWKRDGAGIAPGIPEKARGKVIEDRVAIDEGILDLALFHLRSHRYRPASEGQSRARLRIQTGSEIGCYRVDLFGLYQFNPSALW